MFFRYFVSLALFGFVFFYSALQGFTMLQEAPAPPRSPSGILRGLGASWGLRSFLGGPWASYEALRLPGKHEGFLGGSRAYQEAAKRL